MALNPSMPSSPSPSGGGPPAAKRLMMALSAGAGLILLGGGGALFGMNSKLTGLQTTAQQKENEVGGSQQIARRYDTTLAAFNDTQEHIKNLETSVSAKSYMPTLLGQLQQLALTTHLTVTAVRPAPPAPPPAAPARPTGGDAAPVKAPAPPPYDSLPIEVDVTGTYADTATFLYSLTRFPKILSVSGAQLHPDALPAGSNPYAKPTVTTNLKLVAFMFHDGSPDAAAPVAATPALPVAVLPAPAAPGPGIPRTFIPPASVGTLSGAAGRAAAGAVGATRATNARASVGIETL